MRRIPAPLNGKSILADQEMAAKNERYAEKPVDGADASASNEEPVADGAKTIEGADEADRIASLLQHAHAQIDQFPVPVRGGRRGGHRGGRHGHTPGRWGNGRFGGQHAERAPQPSSNYICHRCNQPGHWIDQCPTNGDPTYDKIKVRAPTGIPRSMLRQVEKPESGTGLKDSSGHFVTLQPNEEEFARQTVGLRLSNAGTGQNSRVSGVPDFRSPAQSGSISDVKLNESEEKVTVDGQSVPDPKDEQATSENDVGTTEESGAPNGVGTLPTTTEGTSNGPQGGNNRQGNSSRPNHLRHSNNRVFNQNQGPSHSNRRHNNGPLGQNNSQAMQTPMGLPVPPGMPPPGFPQVGMPFGPPIPPGLLMAMMAGMNPNAPNGMRAPNGLPGPLPPGMVPPFGMPFPPPINPDSNKPSSGNATEGNESNDNNEDHSVGERKGDSADSGDAESGAGDENESGSEKGHANDTEWPDREVDYKHEERKSQEIQTGDGHSQRSREALRDSDQRGDHDAEPYILDERPRSYDEFRNGGDHDIRTQRVLLSKGSTHSPRVNEDDHGFTDGRKASSPHNRFPPNDRIERRADVSFNPDERRRPDRYYNADHSRVRARIPDRDGDLDRDRERDRDRDRIRDRTRDRDRDRDRAQLGRSRDLIRERERDRERDAVRDRERERERERERGRERDRPRERDRERDFEGEHNHIRGHDWDRERNRPSTEGRFSPDGGRKYSGERWPRRERSAERPSFRGREREREQERDRERLRDRDRERNRFWGSPLGRAGNRLSPDGVKRRRSRSRSRSRSPSPSHARMGSRVSTGGPVAGTPGPRSSGGNIDRRVDEFAKRKERFGNAGAQSGRKEEGRDRRVNHAGSGPLDRRLGPGHIDGNTDGGWGPRSSYPPGRWSPKQRPGFERMRDYDRDRERERERDRDRGRDRDRKRERDRDRDRDRETGRVDEPVWDRDRKWERERGREGDSLDVRGTQRGRWSGGKRERDHERGIGDVVEDRGTKRGRLGLDHHDDRRDRRSVHDRLGRPAIEHEGRPQRRSVHERLG